MISITVRKPYLKVVDKQQVRTTAESALTHLLHGKQVDLSILICSDEEILKFNNRYRNIHQATDVLSFESDEVSPESETTHLGDILISYDSAHEHSIRYSQDVSVEILVLLIHGILHLVGFDHSTIDAKKQMWIKQYEIHHLLNISIDQLPGENE